MKHLTFLLVVCMSFFDTTSTYAQLKMQGNNLYTLSDVGIGTTNPTENLEVKGSSLITGRLQVGGLLFGGNLPGLTYDNANTSIGVADTASDLHLQSYQNIWLNTATGRDLDFSSFVKIRSFSLEHQGADFRLGTADGRDIGTKTSQRALVHWVDNNANVKDILAVNFNGDFEGGTRIMGKELIVDGHVGIGTNTPARLLTLSKTLSGDDAQLEISNGRGASLLLGQNGSSSNQYSFIKTHANEDLRFQIGQSTNNSNPDVIIKSNGNLGIGTNNPLYKLTVNSSIASVNNENELKAILATANQDNKDESYGYFQTYGPNGKHNFRITTLKDNKNYGALTINNENGDTRLLAGVHTTRKSGFIELLGEKGKVGATIYGANNRGYLSLNDEDGDTKVYTGVGPDKDGFLRIDGLNGRANIILSKFSRFPNHGSIYLYDEFEKQQAGIYVNNSNQGIVFADIKNFRMKHPARDGKEIWYASLEGPEAAAYERGEGQLKNGEVFIDFSDHFQIVTSNKNMTVILTPHSTNTYGLAVIEKTSKGIRVKELMKGKGNFKFDWEVKAIRKGYEKYRVIRNASEMQENREEKPNLSNSSFSSSEDKKDRKNGKDEKVTRKAIKNKATLGQNRPNPFGNTTIIPFTIKDQAQKAKILIYSTDGRLIKEIPIQERGDGEIEVQLDNLANGSYFYTLIVDDQLIDTKQMVQIK